jgi:hypothetical protein
VLNPDEIVCDPTFKKQINKYHLNVQEEVRTSYLLNGPTQQIMNFPKIGSGCRAFTKAWYDKYDWIEYSESRKRSSVYM